MVVVHHPQIDIRPRLRPPPDDGRIDRRVTRSLKCQHRQRQRQTGGVEARRCHERGIGRDRFEQIGRDGACVDELEHAGARRRRFNKGDAHPIGPVERRGVDHALQPADAGSIEDFGHDLLRIGRCAGLDEFFEVRDELFDIKVERKERIGLRLLESATADDGVIRPFEGDMAIFITPGYRFRAIDGLMTNFHLPRSTLFMLVSALMGLERMKKAYAYAIDNHYRFYSYGDASLLIPAKGM